MLKPKYVSFFFSIVPFFHRRGAPIRNCIEPHITLSAISGPTGSHFKFCSRCGVADDEQVSPVPLGWYSNKWLIHVGNMSINWIKTLDYDIEDKQTGTDLCQFLGFGLVNEEDLKMPIIPLKLAIASLELRSVRVGLVE